MSSSPVFPAARLPGPRRPGWLRAVISGPAIALLALAGAAAGGLPAVPLPVTLAARTQAGPPAPRGAVARPPVSGAPASRRVVPDRVSPARARAIAQSMLGRYGWSAWQWPYLRRLWEQESGWRVGAYNRRSGATGIPQADPGRRMASVGRDWRTSARVQIIWGLRYIKRRYGSPRAAWAHEVRRGWY